MDGWEGGKRDAKEVFVKDMVFECKVAGQGGG